MTCEVENDIKEDDLVVSINAISARNPKLLHSHVLDLVKVHAFIPKDL